MFQSSEMDTGNRLGLLGKYPDTFFDKWPLTACIGNLRGVLDLTFDQGQFAFR